MAPWPSPKYAPGSQTKIERGTQNQKAIPKMSMLKNNYRGDSDFTS